jgi:hypothetical protein
VSEGNFEKFLGGCLKVGGESARISRAARASS